ncbi:hypothetical protein SO802_014902 [Lithocarpus litseifolius]|uniref:Uncharacterized protein n=1 Tax=Lithocarpus litseifolius TaxID=425828 RepID=A0AAW2CSI3_9ROSI
MIQNCYGQLQELIMHGIHGLIVVWAIHLLSLSLTFMANLVDGSAEICDCDLIALIGNYGFEFVDIELPMVTMVPIKKPRSATAERANRKPNCNAPGAGCYDPRFIGGDGIVFYFHGKSNEHFSLVSDLNLQINARFTGLRPAGRTRDYTWIQALGVLFDTKTFSLEAITAATWDDEVDHLKFSYNGTELVIPEGHLSAWKSPENDLIVERHQTRIVLTYQPDFKNPAKPGVAMPVMGGEDKYRTTLLVSADCSSCVFSPAGVVEQKDSLVMEYGMLDCTGGATGGNGIVCRK